MSYKNKENENKNKREYYANHPEHFKERGKINYLQQKPLRKIDRAMKRQFIQDYKLSKGCSICGYNKCGAALEFHHVKDDKNFEVGKSMSRTFDIIKIEMEKCIILCANCHKELHEKLRK